MARIAFCGLGLMGVEMAGCLQRAGHDLRLWNRTPGKGAALIAAGATLTETPRAAAVGADAAFSMVADDDASRTVWTDREGMLAALEPGSLAIECSTLSHAWVMELAKRAEEKRVDYVDCPVTGLPEAARRGALTLLVGGQPDTVAAARAYLDPLCEKIVCFGPLGAGTAYKLIVNLLGAVEIAATAEAMETARRAGLELDQVAESLASGAAGSFHVGRQARIMAAESHAEQLAFTTDLRRKDTRYAVNLCHDLGVASPLGDVALTQFDHTSQLGFGSQNESHVLDAVRDKSKG
jgi:3-hydroxyisobutyrate dehydrogenase